MDIDTVVVPQSPGVLSARGLLIADVRIDEARAYGADDVEPGALETAFDAIERRLYERLETQGFERSDVEIDRALDVRYRGQSYEITVPFPDGPVNAESVATSRERFDEEHERLYGHAMRDAPIEIVTVRGNGLVSTPGPIEADAGSETELAADEREVYFDDAGFVPTDVYERASVRTGGAFAGPAIIEEDSSTTLVPPGSTARISDHGAIRIDL
jgi:N-methylhydantoinase A